MGFYAKKTMQKFGLIILLLVKHIQIQKKIQNP